MLLIGFPHHEKAVPHLRWTYSNKAGFNNSAQVWVLNRNSTVSISHNQKITSFFCTAPTLVQWSGWPHSVPMETSHWTLDHINPEPNFTELTGYCFVTSQVHDSPPHPLFFFYLTKQHGNTAVTSQHLLGHAPTFVAMSQQATHLDFTVTMETDHCDPNDVFFFGVDFPPWPSFIPN